MASVITRSAHPDALWPGIQVIFGLQYDQYDTEWSEIFDEVKGDKAFEKLMEATGFGLAKFKSEAAAIEYDSDGEGYVTVATPFVLGLGYQVTREEQEDNLYAEISGDRAGSLAFSMHTTIEFSHSNVLVNGFSGSTTYGDGQPLFSASHPTKSGLQSNLPTVNADFSEAALEDMVKRVGLARNSRGLPIQLMSKKLIVSVNDEFNAARVLQSTLRTNTANNDINAIKAMGMIPEGASVNHYLGSSPSAAWYLKTNIRKGKGMVSIWRRKPQLEMDNDFDTENARAKSTSRFVPTVADWRAMFASPGA